jgi:hypothetical protein
MLYNFLDEEEYKSFDATKIGTIKVEIWHAKIIGYVDWNDCRIIVPNKVYKTQLATKSHRIQ